MIMSLEAGMKHISRFAIICLVLGMLSCGGPSGPEPARPADAAGKKAGKAKATNAATANPAAGAADILRLSSVDLNPANPSATTDLKAQAVIAEPVPEGVDFQYRWFVNDKLVANAGTADLACANFRKKQWVYCEAKAITGEKESEWLFSKRVRIANTPPQLTAPPLGTFWFPGDFTYQLIASDPDQDPLTYELMAPLDEGIALDARTGLLTWKIDGETVKRLGEQIKIQFAVSDGDGGKTNGSITLDLAAEKK
jgi:hypothetical protein